MKRERVKKLLYGAILTIFFALSLAFSEESRATLALSLETCAKTLVPSIFPFAVIGALVGSGIAEFPRWITCAFSWIFGISEGGAKALLSGLFTGFPVGCTAACGLYGRGEISEREFCRICALSVTPGAAFVISGVGGGMFKSAGVGAIIYMSVISSVFLVGIATGSRRKIKNENCQKFSDLPPPALFEAVTDAVGKSGYSMLTMTAFIAFFAQISLFLTKACEYITDSAVLTALVKAFVEISSASSAASKIGDKNGILLAVFACAWSGISVHMQTLAVCAHCRSKKLLGNLVFLRALIALFSLLIALAVMQIFALY